jgi:hypothetical protein
MSGFASSSIVSCSVISSSSSVSISLSPDVVVSFSVLIESS